MEEKAKRLKTPPRLDSLNPFTIQIIQHSKDKTNTIEILNVFPFETLYNLKQRITYDHINKKTEPEKWLPNQMFLAEEKDGKYVPLEFEWEFQRTFNDPYDPAVLGKPFRQLYNNDERIPITPTLFSGITLESKLKSRIVHVWNIGDVANATGFKPSDDISDEVFYGFLCLYFPMLSKKEDFLQSFLPIDTNVFEILETHRNFVSSRYLKLEGILKSEEHTKSAQPVLSELLDLHYTLPKSKTYGKGFLELRFYEMSPSPETPFLRFFPASERDMPITKLAATGGISAIENKKLLTKLMDDQPSSKLGAVILIKAPVIHPEAPLGTTWTIRIFEDGSAELNIGAPRKNQPLTGAVLTEAFKILPNLLKNTPWLPTTDIQLSQLSAIYKAKSHLESKPNKEELLLRLDPFLPLFYAEKGIDPTAQINLRYKAVSNYVRDADPIMDYIATLYLRDSATSVSPMAFQSYIIEVIKEFGISKKEAMKSVDLWVQNHSEQMMVGSRAHLERNIGSAISIYNDHPNYKFLLTNVGSTTDLNRILSLLTIFVENKHESLKVAESVKEIKEVEKAIQEVEEEVASQHGEEEEAAAEEVEEGEWSFSMAARLPHANDEEDEEEEEEEKKEEPKEQKPEPIIRKLASSNTVPALSDEWYLDNLKEKNSTLFAYTDSPKPYSRVCQASSAKQPNVMDFATYKRARLFYKTDVFWVESPLSERNLFLLQFVSKTVSERMKLGKTNNMSNEEMIENEKSALKMGFPMKKNESIISVVKSKNPADEAKIKDLITQQESKPLWVVVRAGTEHDKPNYYICAEFWCLRDNLPIVPSEFEGTDSRRKDDVGNTVKKEKESCPVCGGKVIENHKSPKPGETIVRRKQPAASKIQKYAGFAKVIHPNGYMLPCCFADPNNQDIPEDTKPLPAKLPIDVDEDERKEEAGKKVVLAIDKENRNRPFSPTKKGTSSMNEWYIPNQNVLGRLVDRWLTLEKGSVAVPSKAVNKLFGQDPEKFLTKKGGILQGQINSQLTTPAHAFVQYGLGNSLRQPGHNIISLIAFAQYSSSYTLHPDDSLSIQPVEAVIESMLETNEVETFHAFQTVNYGTLVHEFSVPEETSELDGEFQAWYSSVAYRVAASQRAYFKNLFLAWNNFKNYVRDKEEAKELRLWEGLFAVPGLFTKDGFIIVKIIVPKNPNDDARIECPEFGISLRAQKTKPPLLFILQDSATGLYDPLVLYEGVTKDDKRILGVLQDNSPIFGKLSPHVREPLNAFLAKYYQPLDGCGRIAAPIHPWIPEGEMAPVPRLGDLATYSFLVETLLLKIHALIRDRSNRLVGVAVKHTQKPPKEVDALFFIPCVDDGTVLQNIPCLYGEEELPRPTLKDIIEMLRGKQIQVSPHKIAYHYKGLLPKKLLSDGKDIVALDLVCGATIPCARLSLAGKAEIQKLLKDLPIVSFRGDMPWETDIVLLGPEKPDAEKIGQTEEETLEESYQHLRITISNWLNDEPQGRKVRKQIELLRQARKRLPLFELQKRLDILLTPYVHKILTTDGTSASFLLRKDCLQIKKETECLGGCSWSDGRCLIHTTETKRFVDPKRVLTARLVDELLRSFGSAMEIMKQHVSYLKPIAKDQIVQEGDTLLFSAFGKGDELLYDKLGYSRRRPGMFTQALTYPEEVSMSEISVGSSGYIPEDWEFDVPNFAVDIRSDVAKLTAALVIITGKSIEELEKELGTFTGTKENWEKFGEKVGANIILTSAPQGVLEIHDFINLKKKNYIIVNFNGVPLLHKSLKKFIVDEKFLPKSLRLQVVGPDVSQTKPEEPKEKEEPVAKEKEKEPREEKALTFTLEDCRTISDINNIIDTIYHNDLGREEERTKETGENLRKFKHTKYYTMFSSANNFDCLIHTFLTAVSENFRRLNQDDKNKFANYFRISIYPSIIRTIGLADAKITQIMRRVPGREFLEDEDIENICAFYNINMIVFEDEKKVDVLGYHEEKEKEEEEKTKPKKLKTKKVKMPRCVLHIERNADRDEAYMIYNNGDHFEAVRTKAGYIIRNSIAKEIHTANPCQFENPQVVGCLYSEGETVLYKGSPHYIIYRKSNADSSCNMYGLTDSEDRLKEFLALPQTEKDSTSVLKRFGTIEAVESELKGLV